MIKLVVAIFATILKPSTASHATTAFASVADPAFLTLAAHRRRSQHRTRFFVEWDGVKDVGIKATQDIEWLALMHVNFAGSNPPTNTVFSNAYEIPQQNAA